MKPKHLVWLRRFSQAAFLVFFLFLLIESRLPQDAYIDYTMMMEEEKDLRLEAPVTFFFQINPLIAITSLLSGHTWIKGVLWAAAVVLMTMLLGRIFCGFICPFGTIHHMTGTLRPALKGRRMIEANRKTYQQRFKYFLLFALLISAILGLNYAGVFDPISLLFRSLALSILPAAGLGLKSIFDSMASSDIHILNLISYGAEEFVSPVFGYGYPAYQTGWLIGLVCLFILFLNRIRPRFWCRVLCPLGALLGLLSRFSLLKLEQNEDKCTQCNRCVKSCLGAASPKPDQLWDGSECISCFNCYKNCPEEALVFRFTGSKGRTAGPDVSRRAMLGSLTAGVALPYLGQLDGRIHRVSDPNLIRPPGSLPEKEFLELCQRCGLCMKACPTNVIHPTLTEAGMAGFWTPNLMMNDAYCEYSCTLCGTVCSTGAIRQLTAKEKTGTPIRIGSAYIDRGRCLPWSGNTTCIMCEEVCPVSPKAVYLQDSTVARPDGKSLKVQLPYVDLKQCIGCGMCVAKCPVKGKPAIRVIAAGESRSKKNQILLTI